MKDLLFEIGTEELPALSIEPALSFMRDFMENVLQKERLSYTKICIEGTPRRLVLMVYGLAQQQEDIATEVVGPKASIAYDEHGNLTPAGLGFLKTRQLSQKDVYFKGEGQNRSIAAKITQKGMPTAELLPGLLTSMMASIPFSKRMRWNQTKDTFLRPIRWILALFGSEILPVQFANIQAGNQTYGHRFMAPSAFRVDSISSYLDTLARSYVMLSSQERFEVIQNNANQLAKQVSGTIRHDPHLLEILKNLVEYPWPLLGQFDATYLGIPKEILICEMREHQKYLSIESKDGTLMPYFIIVAGSKAEDTNHVISGNVRVLQARFEDGAFYYHEDLKSRLEDWQGKLSGIVFHQRLGTLADKTNRIQHVTNWLCDALGIESTARTHALRIASLCKADLLCGVVGQFPDLQGVMGRVYAKHQKEPIAVCQGIEEHYWPKGALDHLPSSEEACLVGIADRIDTLVGFIAAIGTPKGNSDPFALRRHAIAICRILLEQGYRLSISNLIQEALSQYTLLPGFQPKASTLKDAEQFLLGRARTILLDEAVEHPTIADAVLATFNGDMTDTHAKLQALLMLQTEHRSTFLDLATAFKRASNLVSKAKEKNLFEKGVGSIHGLEHPSEIQLQKQLEQLLQLFELKNQQQTKMQLIEYYLALFRQIALLAPTLDQFFQDVMVMVDDFNLRHARLELLSQLESSVCSIADLKRIPLT